MKTSRVFLTGLTLVSATALASCAILDPGETGLSPDQEIVVTSSEAPVFQPQETSEKHIKENLGQTIKDEGLGLEFTFQGVYSDDIQGTVVTVEAKNVNDVPFPSDALGDAKLEITDGMGGWTTIDQLPYDPEVNTTVNAPGLDMPLGSQATTNLQYRFDTYVDNVWSARFSLGNIVWEGNLNL